MGGGGGRDSLSSTAVESAVSQRALHGSREAREGSDNLYPTACLPGSTRVTPHTIIMTFRCYDARAWPPHARASPGLLLFTRGGAFRRMQISNPIIDRMHLCFSFSPFPTMLFLVGMRKGVMIWSSFPGGIGKSTSRLSFCPPCFTATFY